MFLPSSLLTKLIHDAVLKLVGSAPYDIDRINSATESGGLAVDGEVDVTIVAGGTSQAVKVYTESYKLQTVTASLANGTLTTTADLDWNLNAEGSVRRSGNADGEVRLEIVSDNDGIVASAVIDRSSNVISKFTLEALAEDLTIASVLTLEIAGDTVTGEVFKLTDVALFAESTT